MHRCLLRSAAAARGRWHTWSAPHGRCARSTARRGTTTRARRCRRAAQPGRAYVQALVDERLERAQLCMARRVKALQTGLGIQGRRGGAPQFSSRRASSCPSCACSDRMRRRAAPQPGRAGRQRTAGSAALNQTQRRGVLQAQLQYWPGRRPGRRPGRPPRPVIHRHLLPQCWVLLRALSPASLSAWGWGQSGQRPLAHWWLLAHSRLASEPRERRRCAPARVHCPK